MKTFRQTRRLFLSTLASGIGGLCLFEAKVAVHSARGFKPHTGKPDAWAAVPAILRRINPPRFRQTDFAVTAYGARGDSTTNSKIAINKAIAACAKQGGGRVVIPPGDYVSNGTVRLLSNVNLHLEAGATLRFGINPNDYLPGVLVRWEGTRCFNYSPLIYAYRQRNIAITGEGIIDGRAADFWYAWKQKQEPDKAVLRRMGQRVAPVRERVFGANHFLRPDLFQPYECRNLLIEGVTFKGSPFWTVHPVLCSNVTVRNIRVEQGTTNDDGVDPESCRDVLIENCTFSTKDDNIAIKAGRDQDAWGRGACENIVIRNCTGVYSEANGFCIGSEMSGNVRNVFIENCKVGDVQSALYIKSNTDRGGTVENVFMRDVEVESCDTCINLETNYKGVDNTNHPSRYRNFQFENIACQIARKRGLYSVGIARQPIRDVRLKNVTIERATNESTIAHTLDLQLNDVSINGKRQRPG